MLFYGQAVCGASAYIYMRRHAHSQDSTTLALRNDHSYLFQPLHVVWLHTAHGGFPSLSREVINEILQKVSEFLLGFLNVDIGSPDDQVGLRPSLTSHPRRGGITSLGKGERGRGVREGRLVS